MKTQHACAPLHVDVLPAPHKQRSRDMAILLETIIVFTTTMKKSKSSSAEKTAPENPPAPNAPPGKKGGRRRNQDPAQALLSLGQDLSNVGGEKEESSQPVGDGDATKKRKLEGGPSSEDPSSENGYVVDGVLHPLPPDFWYWLPVGEKAGDWDVICGRGGERYDGVQDLKQLVNAASARGLDSHALHLSPSGESNNYVGNKKYRQVVKDRKVSSTVRR